LPSCKNSTKKNINVNMMATQTRQLCFEYKWVKGERDYATVQRNITHQFSEGMGQCT